MDIKKDGGKAVKWSLLDKLLKRGVQFILSIFLARLLTPDDFGVIAMATIFVSWGEVFRDFGLGQALVQKKDVTDVHSSTIFYLNVIMGCIIAGLLFLIAPLAASFYNNHMVAWVVRISGLTFILNGLNVVQNSLLTKELNYKIGTVSSFLASTISGVIGVILAFGGLGVWSLLIQSIVSASISTMYIWYKSNWRPKPIFNFRETIPLLKKGIGFMGQGLVDNVFNYTGTMVIGKMFSPGLLGIYDRGHTLADMPNTTFITPITRPLFPVFSKLQDNIIQLREYYIKILDILNWVLILISGIFLLCSNEIILILLGEKWSKSSDYFFLLSMIIPLLPNWSVITSLWKGLGLVRKVTFITFLEKSLFLLAIPALFISLKLYALCIVISHFIANIIKASMNVKITGVSLFRQYKEWMIEVLVIILMLGLSQFFHIQSQWFSLIAKTGSFLIAYIFASAIFNLKGYLIIKNQIKLLIPKLSKNGAGKTY